MQVTCTEGHGSREQDAISVSIFKALYFIKRNAGTLNYVEHGHKYSWTLPSEDVH